MQLLKHLLLSACLLLASGERLTSSLTETVRHVSVSSITSSSPRPASTSIAATRELLTVSSPTAVSTAALAGTDTPYLFTAGVPRTSATVPSTDIDYADTTGSSTVTAESPKNATASSASNSTSSFASELANTSVVTSKWSTVTATTTQLVTSVNTAGNNSYNTSISTEKPFTLANGTVVFTPVNATTGSTEAGVGITTTATSSLTVLVHTASATFSLAAERVSSEVQSAITGTPTESLEKPEQKALSSGSIAAVTVTIIVVVLLIFGGATYIKMSRSSYGRLLDDQDYGSWGNYNNPLYDDS
ncbi:prostate androgen-regulated mucin-like protein 1 [Protopterus annectens]|uniref:prostate androgen-regulated mucin-like protein 1 n=1 Tax=Protopterus annectens TaxID=7888 RepID=UPI001CFAD5A7|nr:prostate androgen-regulated mucin-like protein 1 [Protopterus annectens]